MCTGSTHSLSFSKSRFYYVETHFYSWFRAALAAVSARNKIGIRKNHADRLYACYSLESCLPLLYTNHVHHDDDDDSDGILDPGVHLFILLRLAQRLPACMCLDHNIWRKNEGIDFFLQYCWSVDLYKHVFM